MVLQTTVARDDYTGRTILLLVPDSKADEAGSVSFASGTIAANLVQPVQADETDFVSLPIYPLFGVIERKASLRRRHGELVRRLEASGQLELDPVGRLMEVLGSMPGDAESWQATIDEPYG